VSELSARIASYELATHAILRAGAVDFSRETQETGSSMASIRRSRSIRASASWPGDWSSRCSLRQLWSGAYVNDTVDTWDAHNSIVDNHGSMRPRWTSRSPAC